MRQIFAPKDKSKVPGIWVPHLTEHCWFGIHFPAGWRQNLVDTWIIHLQIEHKHLQPHISTTEPNVKLTSLVIDEEWEMFMRQMRCPKIWQHIHCERERVSPLLTAIDKHGLVEETSCSVSSFRHEEVRNARGINTFWKLNLTSFHPFILVEENWRVQNTTTPFHFWCNLGILKWVWVIDLKHRWVTDGWKKAENETKSPEPASLPHSHLLSSLLWNAVKPFPASYHRDDYCRRRAKI